MLWDIAWPPAIDPSACWRMALRAQGRACRSGLYLKMYVSCPENISGPFASGLVVRFCGCFCLA
jgi:hypothetical protein